jgi:hypothetical protein
MLKNETLNCYVESQTEKTKPGYVTVKALESGVTCALSGLHGQDYRIHELQHVYFARSEGTHILEFKNNYGNKLRYLVESGRGYYIVNSGKVVEMERNRELNPYVNEKDTDIIEREARIHYDFQEKRRNMLRTSNSSFGSKN